MHGVWGISSPFIRLFRFLRRVLLYYLHVFISVLLAIATGLLTGSMCYLFGYVLDKTDEARHEHYRIFLPLIFVAGFITTWLFTNFGTNTGKGFNLLLDNIFFLDANVWNGRERPQKHIFHLQSDDYVELTKQDLQRMGSSSSSDDSDQDEDDEENERRSVAFAPGFTHSPSVVSSSSRYSHLSPEEAAQAIAARAKRRKLRRQVHDSEEIHGQDETGTTTKTRTKVVVVQHNPNGQHDIHHVENAAHLTRNSAPQRLDRIDPLGSAFNLASQDNVLHGYNTNSPLYIPGLRMIVLSIGCTWLGHLFGASIGQEGIAIVVGGCIGHVLYKYTVRYLSWYQYEVSLLYIGMASGFSGLFHTPLAASFFVMELTHVNVLQYQVLFPTLLASYSAYWASRSLGAPLFEVDIRLPPSFQLELVDLPTLIKLIIFGCVYAALSTGFTYLNFILHDLTLWFPKWFAQWWAARQQQQKDADAAASATVASPHNSSSGHRNPDDHHHSEMSDPFLFSSTQQDSSSNTGGAHATASPSDYISPDFGAMFPHTESTLGTAINSSSGAADLLVPSRRVTPVPLPMGVDTVFLPTLQTPSHRHSRHSGGHNAFSSGSRPQSPASFSKQLSQQQPDDDPASLQYLAHLTDTQHARDHRESLLLTDPLIRLSSSASRRRDGSTPRHSSNNLIAAADDMNALPSNVFARSGSSAPRESMMVPSFQLDDDSFYHQQYPSSSLVSTTAAPGTQHESTYTSLAASITPTQGGINDHGFLPSNPLHPTLLQSEFLACPDDKLDSLSMQSDSTSSQMSVVSTASGNHIRRRSRSSRLAGPSHTYTVYTTSTMTRPQSYNTRTTVTTTTTTTTTRSTRFVDPEQNASAMSQQGMVFNPFQWFTAEKCARHLVTFIGCGITLALVYSIHADRYCSLGRNIIAGVFLPDQPGNVVYKYDWAVKLFATMFSVHAGIRGGEMTPIFSIGASFGWWIAPLFDFEPRIAGVLGYVAFFSGATQTLLAPIMLCVEVFEPSLIVHATIVCLVTFCLSGPKSIYGPQKRSFFKW